MKKYIVYNSQGDEVDIIDATGHNKAEQKAQELYGQNVIVC